MHQPENDILNSSDFPLLKNKMIKMNFYVCYVLDLLWDMKVVKNVATSI
jgi:hypothetical protein